MAGGRTASCEMKLSSEASSAWASHACQAAHPSGGELDAIDVRLEVEQRQGR